MKDFNDMTETEQTQYYLDLAQRRLAETFDVCTCTSCHLKVRSALDYLWYLERNVEDEDGLQDEDD